ncbi:MAG: acylneuraminate cytidylyltransferase [Elusimicrobia bacterium]|nr:acylneuraminate cytidylyltransferase [Elusimicrobiota bacterium]
MNIAFIPVRGGSKSIPLKNIKELAGRPLVYWTAAAADAAKCINKVIIATDDRKIKDAVKNFNLKKVEIYDREPQNAQDASSTESVMLEYIKKAKLKPSDNFFLIQATSPLLKTEHIEAAFSKMQLDKADSLLTCVRSKRFFWTEDGKPVNYDYRARPRRQDFKGMMMENGALYINRAGNILRDKNRLSGKISVYEMPEYTAVEIDEPHDFITAETLMRAHAAPVKHKYKMFLTDCDGVLTDGGMYYGNDGRELKKFNTKDGMAFEILRKAGFITGIITGEISDAVKNRAAKIKADELKMGVKDKLSAVKEICKKYKIPLSGLVYVGDDINDVEVIKAAGLGCSVADAQPAAKAAAKYVTAARGGRGAVREIVNKICGETSYEPK